jgi:hypothetical protein
MIKFDKIGIEEIGYLANYLFEHRNEVDALINDFGKVASTNDYGTLILDPTDPIFKLVWLHIKETALDSAGLVGPHWQLKLNDLVSCYGQSAEGYSRYDDGFVYGFFQNTTYSYGISIFSKKRLHLTHELGRRHFQH